MKVLIVDDEPLARARLRSLLEELAGYTVAGEAGDGAAALAAVDGGEVEIVLLDIRMPGMNGLEAARHLAELEAPPAVIFTTAYGEHALEAFEANAVDYLLKPVRKERLADALARARRPTLAQLNSVNDDFPGGARQQLTTRIGGRLERIEVKEVRAFVAEQKYVTIHHPGGEALIEESLKSLEQEFGPRFLRIHRNALINTAFLRGMEKSADGGWRVLLDGMAQRIEVSRRHVAELRQTLKS
ncbi:LytR/AlgR family response regulator transcription factor [Endothiovibrio diazotrophicus]